MLTPLCIALAALILVVELHPNISTQNCITKFGLLMLQVSTLLLSGGVVIANQGVVAGCIVTLVGFTHRYVLGSKFDKRRRETS